MAFPYACPICFGRGFVDASLYTSSAPDGTSTSVDTRTAQCRSCNGTGIVWDYTVVSLRPAFPRPLITDPPWGPSRPYQPWEPYRLDRAWPGTADPPNTTTNPIITSTNEGPIEVSKSEAAEWHEARSKAFWPDNSRPNH